VLFGRLGLKNDGLARSYCGSSLFILFCHVLWSCHSLGDAVKWLAALVLVLALHSTGKDLCSVREFYSIAWGVHDPTERHKQMAEWLTKHQHLCKSTDFIVIWNNLSEWGGTSDSHNLRALVISGYKEALQREKK
jgi:hypothetical protein